LGSILRGFWKGLVAMKTYISSAHYVDGWWWLECKDAPGANSQLKSLADLDQHKEAISHIDSITEGEIEIELRVDLDDSDDNMKLKRYVELANQLSKLNQEFSGLQLDLTKKLVRVQKFSYRDVARILGLSHQRIGQLVAAFKN
jgi:hypothetical protein